MESQSKNKKPVVVAFVNICRLLLALVLIVSGFLKAVDPVAAVYKLQEYAVILSVEHISDGWLLAAAVVQAGFEFLLGLYLLAGIYRGPVTFFALLTMLVFTPLSFYLWQSSAIGDCGCFGESLVISNEATFYKNLVLLFFAFVVFFGRTRFIRGLSRRSRWMLALFSVAYVFFLQVESLVHLPVIDFSPYSKGTNLREMVEFVPDEYEYLSVYSDGAEEITLSPDSVPNTDWVFIGERPVLVKKGREPQISNFSIVDWENDIEMTDEILADTGYVCLVAIECVNKASVTHVDKLNGLYDHCLANSIPFYAATSSDDEEIALWRKHTGAEYPLLWAEETVLRTMIRTNPGLLLLKDGVIVGKWNVADIPELEELEASPTLMPDAVPQPYQKATGWFFWLVLLLGTLLVIVFVDMLAVGIAGRRNRRKVAEEAASTATSKDKPQAAGIPSGNDETGDTN